MNVLPRKFEDMNCGCIFIHRCRCFASTCNIELAPRHFPPRSVFFFFLWGIDSVKLPVNLPSRCYNFQSKRRQTVSNIYLALISTGNYIRPYLIYMVITPLMSGQAHRQLSRDGLSQPGLVSLHSPAWLHSPTKKGGRTTKGSSSRSSLSVWVGGCVRVSGLLIYFSLTFTAFFLFVVWRQESFRTAATEVNSAGLYCQLDFRCVFKTFLSELLSRCPKGHDSKGSRTSFLL